MTRLPQRIRRRVAWSRRQRRGFVTVDTEYLKWLRFANAGMLHPGQFHLFELAVRSLPTADPVLEIGSFSGLSTNVLTYFLRRNDRPNLLVGADPWVFEGENGPVVPETSLTFERYRARIREQFESNVRFWSGDRLPQAFDLKSDDFFAAWAAEEERVDVFGRSFRLGGPLAFAFVDGDHRYEQAKRDLDNVDAFLVPGGLVLLDDSDEFGAFPHLAELAHEVIGSGRYELVAANPHHLLRKKP